MTLHSKIGIFDSGIGGITVTKEIMRSLPHYDIIYLADTARFPYGEKPTPSIIQYATEAVRFLLEEGAQSIVIACNTVCSTALNTLKQLFSIPIFDIIEPVAQQALFLSNTKKVGLLATPQTIQSGLYSTYIDNLIAVPTPLLAQMVEHECTNSQEIQRLVHNYLQPIIGNVDTLILGCTHYSILSPYIQQELGKNVHIVDPAHILAQEVVATLSHFPSHSSSSWFSTQNPLKFKQLAEPILGQNIPSVQLATYARRREIHYV